ncbi:HPr family phosphocarrier protein [Anaerocolumna sp.]|uniref:HPr family phosphocarrier protein n=1 Tax=Anaerocolumna sp. TaxID=2041569 RepID=UPI0028AD4CED|nr:HPr family phosphocarrier protein [Anaerocolumna sp.]
MKQFIYTIKDELGLHARPAGLLVKKAGSFKSNIQITKGTKSADGKRILAIMGLGIKQNEQITVTVEGEDEKQAALELEEFFKSNL